MKDLYCGIDLGTTNVKVLLCDATGHVAAIRSCPTPRISQDGLTMTDPAAILATVERLLAEAWDAGGTGARLAAISSAGVGEDGFMLTPDGTPRDLSIPWFDRRAEAEAQELRRSCPLHERTGIDFDATRTAAKWLWLARNGPAPHAGDVWIALTDWPLVAWSGRAVMTEALAARTACWDITRHSWLAEALTASEAPALPPVVPGGQVVGTARPDSFPVRLGAADARTLIVSGGHDHPVAAATIRAAFPGAIVDSMGTAELIHAEAAGRMKPTVGLVRTLPAAPGMIDACLHVFELDGFLKSLPPDQLRAELAGEGSGNPQIRQRLETAAMVSAQVLSTMFVAGLPPCDVFATGGRARSDLFMQLKADVFGHPIARVEEGELCGLGAAIIAARAAGVVIVPDLKLRVFKPDAARAAHFAAQRRDDHDEIMQIVLSSAA